MTREALADRLVNYADADVALRRVELRLRTAAAPAPADIQQLLRGFFVVRIGSVWLSVALTIPLVRMALSDSTCVILSL